MYPTVLPQQVVDNLERVIVGADLTQREATAAIAAALISLGQVLAIRLAPPSDFANQCYPNAAYAGGGGGGDGGAYPTRDIYRTE